MRHRLISIVILAALLAGCQGRSATQDSASDATSGAAQPTATQPVQTQTPVALVSPPGCTVVSPPPTPGPTSQSLFPAVSAADWVQGPDSASLTFLEYSDFQ